MGTNYDYYPDGTVQVKEVVAANGVDALRQEFTPDATLATEKRFRNDKPHGAWVYYFPGSKTPKQKEVYADGKLHGLRMTYYPSGKPKSEEIFKFNMLAGPSKTWFENGNPETLTEFRNNRRHGAFSAWHDNNVLKEEGQFAADKKHGIWKQYDAGGKLINTTTYRAGTVVEKASP